MVLPLILRIKTVACCICHVACFGRYSRDVLVEYREVAMPWTKVSPKTKIPETLPVILLWSDDAKEHSLFEYLFSGHSRDAFVVIQRDLIIKAQKPGDHDHNGNEYSIYRGHGHVLPLPPVYGLVTVTICSSGSSHRNLLIL